MTDPVTTTEFGKLNPEVKAKWVAALRSGEYKQGRSYLHYIDEGESHFCCLGVLCDLAAKEGLAVPNPDAQVSEEHEVVVKYAGEFSYPPDSVRDWAFEYPPTDRRYDWMVGAEDDDGYGGTYIRSDSLADLNDDRELSFAEIADAIEAAL